MKILKSYIIIKTIVFVFLVNSHSSCNVNETKKKESYLKSVIENCLGNQLNIPDSLITYTPFGNYTADSVQLSHAKLKIYSHINASCPTCIREIKLWYNLIKEFENFKIPIILICESDDDFELFKYMNETGEISNFLYPFFLDVNNDFVKQNKFMKESQQFKTVLTDGENNILLLGNPIKSKEMKSLYLNEIQKHVSKQ